MGASKQASKQSMQPADYMTILLHSLGAGGVWVWFLMLGFILGDFNKEEGSKLSMRWQKQSPNWQQDDLFQGLKKKNSNMINTPQVYNGHFSPGQKWWRTALEIEISRSQPMGRLSIHSKCLDFFSFKSWGGGERIFFHFSFVPNMVPFKFPLCSICLHCVPRRVFPIALCFNFICFAQSPPLLTYISGPKGEALHLSIESSILGSLHSFNSFFFVAMGQSTWLIAKKGKKKGRTCEASPTN